MGDRANIVIPQARKGVNIYLYTHWGGSELPTTLQAALARRQRWDDDSYLTRIIFSEMIKGDVLAETGYGISTTPQDNQYPLLVVDIAKQQVRIQPYVRGSGGVAAPGPPLAKYSFDEYVSLTLPEPGWRLWRPEDYEASEEKVGA